MTTRVLITGIAGQDGSYLAEQLVTEGCEVFGLTRNTEPTIHTDMDPSIVNAIRFIPGDMADADSLSHALTVARPDAIYNLAAQSHVGRSFQEPELTFLTNYHAVGTLVEQAQAQNPAVRIYHASSSEMFGTTPSPQNEQSPFHPVSPYAVSKLRAYEDYVVGYRNTRNLFICSGILFNHESPRRPVSYVTRKITRGLARISADHDECLELGNIDSARDWGYAKDYVRAMCTMLAHDTPEDYVIATGITHTVRDFVTTTAQALNLSLTWEGAGINEVARDTQGVIRVRINPEFYRPLDVQDLRGDSTKARAQLGWKPSVSFEELVTLMAHTDLKHV